MIRDAKNSDIEEIINLHLESFSENHFSTLFPRQVLIKYFTNLLKANDYCYVYYDESTNNLLGYLIAGYNTQKAVSDFRRENRTMLLITLLKHPKFAAEKIIELIKKFFKFFYISKEKCRLYLIATNNSCKGKGIGKEMIGYLEKQLISCGITSYGLSVRSLNDIARNFYNNNGYEVEHESSKSIFYKKQLVD